MGAESQILGIGLGQVEAGIEYGRTKNLMGMQKANQMELNKQGAELQRETWDYTNYENQRKHLENAGLNTGLMYGMSGGGGATTGGQGGGSASSGDAPKSNGAGYMAIGLQNDAIQSQIEVNKAEVLKKDAETKEIQARTPTHVKAIEKTDAEIKKMAVDMGVSEATIRKILADTEVSKAQKENVTADTNLKGAQKENVTADTNLKEAQEKSIETLTPIQAKKLNNDIWAEIEKVEQGWRNLDQEKLKIEIEKFKANLQAKYPSISNASGRVIDSSINQILRLLGIADNEDESHHKLR